MRDLERHCLSLHNTTHVHVGADESERSEGSHSKFKHFLVVQSHLLPTPRHITLPILSAMVKIRSTKRHKNASLLKALKKDCTAMARKAMLSKVALRNMAYIIFSIALICCIPFSILISFEPHDENVDTKFISSFRNSILQRKHNQRDIDLKPMPAHCATAIRLGRNVLLCQTSVIRDGQHRGRGRGPSSYRSPQPPSPDL